MLTFILSMYFLTNIQINDVEAKLSLSSPHQHIKLPVSSAGEQYSCFLSIFSWSFADGADIYKLINV